MRHIGPRPPKTINSRPRPKDIIRFLKKVKVDEKTGCWIWTGHKDKKGYGQFYWNGRAHWAHRISCAIFHGQLPRGIEAHHGEPCYNPSCVNPDHLAGATKSENVAEGNRRRAKNDDLPPKPDDDIPF